jgi:chorismate mutase / prephenate dehydratase
MKIAIQGSPGSFNEEAIIKYALQNGLSNIYLDYAITTENVFKKLKNQEVDLGFFAIFNSGSGLVLESFEAMGKFVFGFVAEYKLKIEQCLHVKKGANIDKIARVVSHPQALAQCSVYLSRYLSRAELKEGLDTAKEVENLINGKYDDKATAIIASRICEEKYGSKVLVDGIQNSDDNFTWFAVVK